MKHDIRIAREIKDNTLYFKFHNKIKTDIDFRQDDELLFVDRYLSQVLGEFEIPGNQVALTGDYNTLKLILALMIKRYNSYNIDAFIPPYI